MSVTRQTISYLNRRFRDVGLEPVSRFGQNFLIDLNLLDVLIDAAELSDRDLVLEIGTGTGSLTALIAQRAHSVVTVEIDARLFQLATEQLDGLDNVVMLQQDALKNKNRMHPNVIDAVQQRLAENSELHLKLVANLPYCIATPVISNMLAAECVPEIMAVTIQRELAERMAATAGTKDYGAFSVWVQSQCVVEILRMIPASAFWPRPQVESAFVKLTFDPQRRARIADLPYFHAFARSMFFHRRKILRSELRSALKGQFDKEQVDAILLDLGLPIDARAEQLTVEGMIVLCEALRSRGAQISL